MSDYTKLIGTTPWNIGGVSNPDDPSVNAHLEQLAGHLFRSPSSENHSIPAGYTYLAQFLNHDLSFPLMADAGLRNARSPRLDLDSLYGRGPFEDPHLFDFSDFAKLAVGRNENREADLPRSDDRSAWMGSHTHASRWRRALIADPRNDENVLVGQVHLAMIRLHNRFVSECSANRDRHAVFQQARRLTTWHYQYVIVNDLLRKLCPEKIWHEVFESRSRGRYFRRRRTPYIPLEFSLAALRVSHSMVREKYKLANRLTTRDGSQPVQLPIFDIGTPANGLVGGRALPCNWSIQWDLFVEHEGSTPQKAMHFDDALAKPLARLPESGPPGIPSLALRTLRACARNELAYGSDVAAALGVPAVNSDDPLWFYFLIEAKQIAEGATFGPCAGRIVAETILGLLRADPDSYLSVDPAWSPGPNFGLRELLIRAGMPMSAADLEKPRAAAVR